jgi:modulator of FtsH protease
MQNQVVIKKREVALSTNKVLRNTYFLLSLTLLFTASTATVAAIYNVAPPGFLLMILGTFGLLFLAQALRNSIWGLVATFAFTGFMGYTLAPLLNFYFHSFTNGGTLIVAASLGTGLIFLLLSGFVLLTRKDFSYLSGFLFAAIIIAFLASLAGLFFDMPIFQVLISALFMLISSGLILFHTSQIINGGETNYITATISLYVALLNIFVSLLRILSFFGGSRD